MVSFINEKEASSRRISSLGLTFRERWLGILSIYVMIFGLLLVINLHFRGAGANRDSIHRSIDFLFDLNAQFIFDPVVTVFINSFDYIRSTLYSNLALNKARRLSRMNHRIK